MRTIDTIFDFFIDFEIDFFSESNSIRNIKLENLFLETSPCNVPHSYMPFSQNCDLEISHKKLTTDV